MIFYICPRCGYEVNNMTKYVNHLKKKKICEPILSKTNLQNEYIKYDIKDKIMIPQNSTISSSKNEGALKITQNTSNLNQCKYCDKVFSRVDNLTRHYKTCKDKKKTDEANLHMEKLVNLLNDKNDKISKYDLELEKKNKSRQQMGREKFLEEVWNWKEKSGNTIIDQLKRLGASCDWSRNRFTMDDGLSEVVKNIFINPPKISISFF